MLAASRLVGQDRGVEDRPYAPPLAVQRIGEFEACMVDRDREADRSFRRKRNGRFERETEPSLGVALAG